jgi:hypothetical protein
MIDIAKSLASIGELHPGLRPLLQSAGPVSDAYIASTDPFAAIVGPPGSGKTVASFKKILLEGIRIRPDPHSGLRRYVLGTWRQKYDMLWGATIKDWLRMFPKDKPRSKTDNPTYFPDFTGSAGRPAQHNLEFRDAFGPIRIEVQFKAFGEDMDPESLRGLQFTDNYFNELDTIDKTLVVRLADRIGRDPPFNIIGRDGRMFADLNAPSIVNWTYQEFWEDPQPGFRLYRQPGGFSKDAENIAIVGTSYYAAMAARNARVKGWSKRFIDVQPGDVTGGNLVYDSFDRERNLSAVPLQPSRQLVVVCGMDAGLTPAAVFASEFPDGQVQIFAEIAMDGASEAAFARAILAVMAQPRFQGCEFHFVIDPAAGAGEGVDDTLDLANQSYRRRLEKHLGHKVHLSIASNNPATRQEAVREKLSLTVQGGRPGLLLDPSAKGLLRGFGETYHFIKTRGTDDLSRVAKTFDSHVHDAAQYCLLDMGTARARRRVSDERQRQQQRREKQRQSPRYNPLNRS